MALRLPCASRRLVAALVLCGLVGLLAACGSESERELTSNPQGMPAGELPEGHPPIGGLPPGHPPTGQPGMGTGMGAPRRTAAVTWTVPEGWSEEKPSSSMRLTQFTLARDEQGNPTVQAIVFGGITGGAEANLERWMGQFQPPAGKSRDEWVEVTKSEQAGMTVTRAEIEGTFLGGMGTAGPESAEGEPWKMLGAVVEGPAGEFHVKLVGPASLVDDNEDEFDALLASMRPR